MNWCSLNAKKLFSFAPGSEVRTRSGTLDTSRRSRNAFRQAATGRPDSSESLAHRLGHRHGLRTDPALVRFGERDAETRLHPHRERVLPEGRIGQVRRHAGVDGPAEVGPYRICGGAGNGDALERLGDDIAFGDPAPEQLRNHACDHAALVVERSFARHRGRGADAQQALGLEPLTDTAHQQRHVGTLAATVCMEFVEDEEPKARAVADDPAVDLLLACHEELEHHEVGEENVRRLVGNPLPFVLVLLSRVAGERDRPASRHLADELVELLHLGVGERVHRVDDDGARARLPGRPPCVQHVTDDGDEEAERLPGPRAGRHHEALTRCGKRDGLLLVLVESQRPIPSRGRCRHSRGRARRSQPGRRRPSSACSWG